MNAERPPEPPVEIPETPKAVPETERYQRDSLRSRLADAALLSLGALAAVLLALVQLLRALDGVRSGGLIAVALLVAVPVLAWRGLVWARARRFDGEPPPRELRWGERLKLVAGLYSLPAATVYLPAMFEPGYRGGALVVIGLTALAVVAAARVARDYIGRP